jgi:hypothetical protein
MIKVFALTSLLLLLLAGCHSYETRTYDLTIRNDSAGPITIWLTKNGPPYEKGWLSPEDIAIESPKERDVIGGVIVPQGKTAYTGARTGRFQSDTSAILRIYGGQLTFNDLLASSRDMANRIDLRLHPGKSDYVVTGPSNAIQVNEAR